MTLCSPNEKQSPALDWTLKSLPGALAFMYRNTRIGVNIYIIAIYKNSDTKHLYCCLLLGRIRSTNMRTVAKGLSSPFTVVVKF